MRDCIIMGCGRSGTSMLAGVLAHSGYDMGRRLLGPDPSNPLGYFEDLDVNDINEALLEPHTPPGTAQDHHERPLTSGERWLAALPLDLQVRPDTATAAAMDDAVARRPYCRKDPRFCYTLPAWRPHLGDPVYVCVFREPARTAHSLCAHTGPRGLGLTFDGALNLWTAVYSHVLLRHRCQGDWVFLHYNQVVDGRGLAKIGRAHV